jgi:hypothetical protein
MQKIFKNHKSFNYLVWTPLGSRVNLFNIFAFKFILRSQQPDSVPPVSTTLGKMAAKFAAGVIDTGGAP